MNINSDQLCLLRKFNTRYKYYFLCLFACTFERGNFMRISVIFRTCYYINSTSQGGKIRQATTGEFFCFQLHIKYTH